MIFSISMSIKEYKSLSFSPGCWEVQISPHRWVFTNSRRWGRDRNGARASFPLQGEAGPAPGCGDVLSGSWCSLAAPLCPRSWLCTCQARQGCRVTEKTSTCKSLQTYGKLTLNNYRASLVAQWLRIHLPMQGTRVRSLVREDPTHCRATKPMRHNHWACALEPASHNYWAHVPQLLSPRATTTEAHMPRARVPQQEKALQWEACVPQRRLAPAHRN